MRITNGMMANNTLMNINRNKNKLSTLDQQYSSGKKIQKPSEDPIIAVRALKLRTNLAELNQYYERNIPDAMSWMEASESALKNISEIMTKMNTSCVQGSNDPLEPSDRESIMKALSELKEQVYQEGNSKYADRFLFTGYKTSTSLMFESNTTDLKYEITEVFSGKDLETKSVVTNNGGNLEVSQAYRLRLSYDNLQTPLPASINGQTITPKSMTDPDAYLPGPNDIYLVQETGELIFGQNQYNTFSALGKDQISIEYTKSEFKKGDIRPEHYFDCKVTDSKSVTTTFKKENQLIEYEINFNQKLAVNTQSKDALTHAFARDIDEIVEAVNQVKFVEGEISEVKKKLSDSNLSAADRQMYEGKLEELNLELTMRSKVMRDRFEHGIATTSAHQGILNAATADLGSRYNRLEVTDSRLNSQQGDFEELLSNNEDADVVETFIRLSSAEALYSASLSAASKVIRNTLLDFL